MGTTLRVQVLERENGEANGGEVARFERWYGRGSGGTVPRLCGDNKGTVPPSLLVSVQVLNITKSH